MTVYMKRKDVPKTCGECRFHGKTTCDVCLLWDDGPEAIVWKLDKKKAGCPIRRVDELGASAEVKIAADGVTCRTVAPLAVAEEYREELAKVRESAEVFHARYMTLLDRDDGDDWDDDINNLAAVDALLELLAACGIGGEGHET